MVAVPPEAFALLAPIVSRASCFSGAEPGPVEVPAIGGPLVVLTSEQAVRASPATRPSVSVWIRMRCHPPKGSAATLAGLPLQRRSQRVAELRNAAFIRFTILSASAYHPRVPGPPLKGPASSAVIHPP